MTTPEDEPMIDVARGDPAVSRRLRKALETLRNSTDNEEFRRLVDDTLAGRSGLRDISRSPAFAQVLDPLVERFAAQYEALSEDERQAMAEQGEQQLAEERERIARDESE